MTQEADIIWCRGLSQISHRGRCEIEARIREDEAGRKKASWTIIAYDAKGMKCLRQGKAADLLAARAAALEAFQHLPRRLRQGDAAPKDQEGEWLTERSLRANVGDFELFAADSEDDLLPGRTIYWLLLKGEDERELAGGGAQTLQEAQQAVLAAFKAQTPNQILDARRR